MRLSCRDDALSYNGGDGAVKYKYMSYDYRVASLALMWKAWAMKSQGEEWFW